ncbi:Uma2 family endonuclease [Streptomyces sp. NPDC058989]|uniref:Uma2 family endonuclease n=1 Tax=Streptomyces sp. NPDC058989 TaxID=3346686 RepID=UPI003689F440
MTALADRPHIMDAEHFEEAARILARLEEGARLELIDGKVRSKPMPDADHALIIEWLTRICIQSRPELWLYQDVGIKAQSYRRGRARPDGTLVRSGAIGGQGDWVNPDPVLMVVEVTSHDSDTHQRDRVEKPRAYAETGIPIYLLIDRDNCQVSVYTEPDGASYENVKTVPYGKKIHLPDPVGITLDTEPLKDWVN